MLVLSRRLGEVLKIGDDVELTILGVQGNQVRLGVEAPKHVAVDRAEIRARKDAGESAPLVKESSAAYVEKTARPILNRNRLYGKRSME